MEIKAFGSHDVEFKSGPEGTFTALIATFDRPDKTGDVLRRGSFLASIAQWRATGHVLPVIFSHAWKDPQQFIGEVDPSQLRETAAGVEASGRLYLDEPNAAKVFKQLQRRTLKEWSYGYTVEKFKTLAAGVRELLQVNLIELGPCVVGMGDTATLATKSEDVTAALRDHRQELTAEQLDPHRARMDVVRRRLALEKAART